MKVIHTASPHVLGYMRGFGTQQRMIVLANFSEEVQELDSRLLAGYGMSLDVVDLIEDKPIVNSSQPLVLEPYQYMWITKKHH